MTTYPVPRRSSTSCPASCQTDCATAKQRPWLSATACRCRGPNRPRQTGP
jgi:hypothetical protein